LQFFLNDTIQGPYSGKEYGRKGDMVLLISQHGIMAIVESNKERFPVKLEKLSKVEVDQEEQEVKKEERPVYIKPSPKGKKQVTNHSNNNQSLF
jgi:hypothetical protein